jgi:hypothetical protein
MSIVELTGFLGANLKKDRRYLPNEVGVNSVNQKPNGKGTLQPWRQPLSLVGPDVPSGRLTLYRLGREVASTTTFWLSTSAVSHWMRDFTAGANDTTERTAFTGSGSPKWTDNIIGLAGAPYPAATRELKVPQPTLPPTVALNADGPSGDARINSYVFTWVSDIGWESAPSPPTDAPSCKPGAILDLGVVESVPAGNYGVNRVRWYRTNVVGTTGAGEFFFIREYAVGTLGMQDDARKLNDLLPTDANNMWLSLSATASWITYCWNEFCAAIDGPEVCFSVPDTIYAYPLGNRYETGGKPLALAAMNGVLLAFTTTGAERFVGQDPEAMDQKPIALPVLVSQRSVAVGDVFVIWAASDGLWMWSVDGTLRNLIAGCMEPEHWAALVPSTIAGYLLPTDERTLYVGFYNDGTLKGFVIDLANPAGIYWLDKGYTSAFYDPLLRSLFVLDSATLKQWDKGPTNMTALHKSKVYRQGETAEGSALELMASGSVGVKVWTEPNGATSDATPLTLRINRNYTRGDLPMPDGVVGRDWQVEVSTAEEVQALVID